MPKQITLIATVTAKPGKAETLGEHLAAMVAPSRAEPGCINYDLHRSKRDDSVWVLYENWRSKEDLDAHMKLPPFVGLSAALPDLIANEVDFHFVSMTSTPAR